jgi:hypothetical protein
VIAVIDIHREYSQDVVDEKMPSAIITFGLMSERPYAAPLMRIKADAEAGPLAVHANIVGDKTKFPSEA